MYSPKVYEKYIPKLYKLAKARDMPMTCLVNEAVKEYLDKIEGEVMHDVKIL